MHSTQMQTEKTDIRLIMLFILCLLSGVIGGTVSTLMSVYLPVVVPEVLGEGMEISSLSAFINAIFILGWAFGGFSWGLISDRIGRKKALLLAIGCYGLATLATGFQHSWEGLVICRFISGFGVGGVLVIAFAWLSEVWPSRSRNIVIGILSIGIPVGIFSAGVINYFLASWRQGFMVGIIPLVLALLGIFLIQVKDTRRVDQASEQRVPVNPFAANNRGNLLFGSLLFSSMLIGLWAIFSWLPTWIQSLVQTGDAQKERGLSMMLLGMGGLIGGFVSGWVANAIGIRKTMMLCFGMCTILAFMLFRLSSSFHPILFAEIGVMAFFFGMSQGALSAYIPQLFPSTVRASSTGFCFNIGRLVTATAVLFVGVLVNSLGGYGNAIFIFSLTFPLGWLVLFANRHKMKKQNSIQTVNQ